MTSERRLTADRIIPKGDKALDGLLAWVRERMPEPLPKHKRAAARAALFESLAKAREEALRR
jgi:hypothetical protein